LRSWGDGVGDRSVVANGSFAQRRETWRRSHRCRHSRPQADAVKARARWPRRWRTAEAEFVAFKSDDRDRRFRRIRSTSDHEMVEHQVADDGDGE
jgi:hypothetical protein